jgi:hypothetical protein
MYLQEIMAVQPMTADLRDDWYDTVLIGEGDNAMHVLRGMTIKAKRGEVLTALRTNRGVHIAIVEEAREGYAKKAEEQLHKAIGDVREGKADPVKGWSFRLQPVVDNTKVYDRAIKMFEMETRDIVELTQEQVGSLVMDEWDWKDDFIGSNSLYSASARDMA